MPGATADVFSVCHTVALSCTGAVLRLRTQPPAAEMRDPLLAIVNFSFAVGVALQGYTWSFVFGGVYGM